MASPFTADVQRPDPGTWLVTVTGELDLATAPELEAAFAAIGASPSDRVLVDLTEVSFLDSSGIRALVRGKRRFDELGAALRLASVSDAARQVLEISGVLQALSEPAADGDD